MPPRTSLVCSRTTSLLNHSPLPLLNSSIDLKKRPSQIRHATLLRRPLRPYTFTQLITLSDGSVTTTRTTSPLPVYKSLKDTRNHPLWNPSSQSLANLEDDEAGRLRAFRKRFGRGWDADSSSSSSSFSSSLSEDGEGEGDEEGSVKDGDVHGEEGMKIGSGTIKLSTRDSGLEEARKRMLSRRQRQDDDDGGLWDLISGFEASDGGTGSGSGSGSGKGKGKASGTQKKGLKGAGETVRGKK